MNSKLFKIGGTIVVLVILIVLYVLTSPNTNSSFDPATETQQETQ